MNKQNFYISVPMKGRTEAEILEAEQRALDFIKEKFGDNAGYIALPTDIGRDLDKFNSYFGFEIANYNNYLAKDIEVMLNLCDVVIMCPGWKKSKGCRVEHYIAMEFKKEIIFLNI
jgi:hypothetical protein